jgi:peptidoglycan/xylan/chitin deacetylase (PgdA/CDA1 family)
LCDRGRCCGAFHAEVLVLAGSTVEASAEPTTAEPTAAPTEAPAPKVTPKYLVVMPTPIAEGYLPIFEKAETNEKIIAVTVDDFYQFQNARDLIDLAVDNGAKLTLFPLGKNVVRKELKDTLRYAYACGMEIENHTYEHRPLYRMNDKAMARQVYNQCLAVDYALGVEYQEHFFRPPGGDGCEDQRTHEYIRQLGMYGVADWTVSGSDKDIDEILDSLAPGNIYLFHTTDLDMEKLRRFIPAAMEAGYTLVTLNEMFGLPDNEVAELKTPVKEHEIPAPEAFALTPRTYGKGDYAWQANLIQQRLVELGYLREKPDGIYGDGTARAVGNFQNANCLTVTGRADPATQDILFSEDAKPK